MARKVSLILSHWHQLYEGFQESPQRIYTLLEEGINRREMPGIKVSQVKHRESGIFSAKRVYFRVRRKEHMFDICAAPFGKSFFVSWWLGIAPGFFGRLILLIPILGPILVRVFRPETYYRLDTALMFQDSVHSAVLEVFDRITKDKGLRALSELERKPILRELFKR